MNRLDLYRFGLFDGRDGLSFGAQPLTLNKTQNLDRFHGNVRSERGFIDPESGLNLVIIADSPSWRGGEARSARSRVGSVLVGRSWCFAAAFDTLLRREKAGFREKHRSLGNARDH